MTKRIKKVQLFVLIILFSTIINAQDEKYKNKYEQIISGTEWFRQARFGMFIHYGVYAIPARGE